MTTTPTTPPLSIGSEPGVDDPLTFSPAPVATGQRFLDANRVVGEVGRMSVMVTDADGLCHEYPLTEAFGAWWVRAPSR